MGMNGGYYKMLTEKIIPPKDIESTLQKMWEDLRKTNKSKASLFNLIVYNVYSKRTDYFRDIILKLIEKFPCRVLFITANFSKKKTFLKTAVSIISPEDTNNLIACDNIDIAVGEKNRRIVPFIILPHLLPNLPTYLLWTENISLNDALFQDLKQLSTRIILDSEATNDIVSFSNKILRLNLGKKRLDIGDLNWARTKQWRDLFAEIFFHSHRLEQINNAHEISITYNNHETPFFCHEKFKSIYFQSWLASRLKWIYVKQTTKKDHLVFQYRKKKKIITIRLIGVQKPSLPTGSILHIKLTTYNDELFSFYKDQNNPYQIHIESSSSSFCEIPYIYNFSKTYMGQSLANEIFYRDTSEHFLTTLNSLIKMKIKKC
jgi:glucose-6-phosphate dehydrogenase assembly protein OpcA